MAKIIAEQTIKISKIINAPKKFVFYWCTDFSEDDPKITGSKSIRKILDKTKKRAVYASLYAGDDGTQKIGVNDVTLKPPDAWHLDYVGEEDNEVADYELTSLGKNKTKLSMVFKEKYKVSNFDSEEESEKRISRIWDMYVSALESEFRGSTKS